MFLCYIRVCQHTAQVFVRAHHRFLTPLTLLYDVHNTRLRHITPPHPPCIVLECLDPISNGRIFGEKLNLASFKLLAKLANLSPSHIFPLLYTGGLNS